MSVTVRRRGRRREDRQELIAQAVLAEGSTTAQQLADAFAVSLNTIHRDLDELEQQGVVRKFHGGVTAQPTAVFEADIAYRMKRMLAQKQAIGRHAARYVKPGMSVMLDDSSTVLQMTPLLAEIPSLTIVTNCLEALRALGSNKSVSLMALGGEYDPVHDAFVGMMCRWGIESLRVDASFISTSALVGGHAYHQDEQLVAIKRAMLEVSTRRYLLIDHSKLGRLALHQLMAVSEFDMMIVDDDAPAEALAELDQYGVAYELAAVAAPRPPAPDRTA